jgi:hypothetical protein
MNIELNSDKFIDNFPMRRDWKPDKFGGGEKVGDRKVPIPLGKNK